MSEAGPRRPRWELLVAAVFLASGASLLVYLLAGLSLRWTFVALGLAGIAVATVVIRGLPTPRRRQVLRRIVIGAIAGAAATAAYDGVRVTLVDIAGFSLKPFEAWRLFGLALAETDQTSTGVFVLGTAFHVINGVAFGVAYAVAFGRKGIWAGIVWALVLEAFMVSVYPGWLGLKAMDEFVSVSVAGHLVYGTVLGGLAKLLLVRSRWGEGDQDADVAGATRSGVADR